MGEQAEKTTGFILLGVIASLISAGAGAYLLLTTNAAGPYDSTVFDVIMHGMGAYFIARGAWMFAELVR